MVTVSLQAFYCVAFVFLKTALIILSLNNCYNKGNVTMTMLLHNQNIVYYIDSREAMAKSSKIPRPSV